MTRLMTTLLAGAACLGCGVAQGQVTSKVFALVPEAKFLSCFATNPAVPPTATVHVQRAGARDKLILTVHGLKRRTAFDVFTVQRSNLLATKAVDPAFTNFGLAWYQSDLDSDASGDATTTLFTVFIDQIFGFNPDARLAPTNTFHIGFWFDNPQRAKACGFDPTQPTPFNGQHAAGPAAMISVPDSKTGLGPLCLNPDPTSPSGCSF